MYFSQEDLQEALDKVEQQQKNWKKITGQEQSKFNARASLAYRNELTPPQYHALLWKWGQ